MKEISTLLSLRDKLKMHVWSYASNTPEVRKHRIGWDSWDKVYVSILRHRINVRDSIKGVAR